ncbi:hypothetical protein CPT_Merlin149 [Citrobacter phage Merlin]|uniref:Uncharacterized protein n=1 Tax=Citrobacter phage Merlin TaxID=1675602 RepID=A0A0K1LNR0_9CAUD|nr:hypothetical protein CPT_Merlin149 [Citrobacter phage Merlin]AKU43795.1 hypothetical protein CPT_Merlin149 [Citrobacter phage Merlin]
MFYEIGAKNKADPKKLEEKDVVPVIHERIRRQLLKGGVPGHLIDKLAPHTFPMSLDYEIHSDQFKRIKCGHLLVRTWSDLRNFLSTLQSECYSIRYTGVYGFYYSDISINNLDREISIPGMTLFEAAGHYAFNLECKTSTFGKPFRISVLIDRERATKRNGFEKKYDLECYSSERAERVNAIAKFISNYNKTDAVDTNLDDFINLCRDELKVKE